MKPRRSPLDKPKHFLESTRAQWVGIGLVLMLIVLLCDIFKDIDPSPYLQCVIVLIGAGVLGWSVDSAMKAYKVDSSTTNQNQHVEQNIKSESKIETKTYQELREYKEHIIIEGEDGSPEIKPYSQKANDE